jgi:hypothetical protein
MAQDIRKLRKDLTLKLGHECDVYSHLRKRNGYTGMGTMEDCSLDQLCQNCRNNYICFYIH